MSGPTVSTLSLLLLVHSIDRSRLPRLIAGSLWLRSSGAGRIPLALLLGLVRRRRLRRRRRGGMRIGGTFSQKYTRRRNRYRVCH